MRRKKTSTSTRQRVRAGAPRQARQVHAWPSDPSQDAGSARASSGGGSDRCGFRRPGRQDHGRRSVEGTLRFQAQTTRFGKMLAIRFVIGVRRHREAGLRPRDRDQIFTSSPILSGGRSVSPNFDRQASRLPLQGARDLFRSLARLKALPPAIAKCFLARSRGRSAGPASSGGCPFYILERRATIQSDKNRLYGVGKTEIQKFGERLEFIPSP